jgi:hypothetical protein
MRRAPPVGTKKAPVGSEREPLRSNQVFGLVLTNLLVTKVNKFHPRKSIHMKKRALKSKLDWLIGQIFRILKMVKFDDVLKVTILPMLKDIIIQAVNHFS